jgi:hypothetical protein
VAPADSRLRPPREWDDRDVRRILRNPVTRTAMLTWMWNNRHDIRRWGQSLFAELTEAPRLSPGRMKTLGKVLWAITSDRSLSKAKQLRSVRLDGDVVELDVDPRWKGTARLVTMLQDVDGVGEVRIRGELTVPTVIDTTAA